MDQYCQYQSEYQSRIDLTTTNHLKTTTNHDDDDDDESFEVDTSSWVVTDPDSVPLKNLKIPEKGKLPAHLLHACAIVGTPQVRPPAAKKFIDQVSRRLEQLGLEYGTNDSTMILTREMTDVEYDT